MTVCAYTFTNKLVGISIATEGAPLLSITMAYAAFFCTTGHAENTVNLSLYSVTVLCKL